MKRLVALVVVLSTVACTTEGTVALPHPERSPAQTREVAPDAPVATPTAASVLGVREQVQVIRVTDGDTVQVNLNGESIGVRYLLIDTPETVDPRAGIQCMGREASARNKELVEGRTVLLEKDVTDRDRFGRLLRYVYLEDGRMVNELLVREGFAALSTVPPDVKYVDLLLAAQGEAVQAGRGLWGICGAATITPLR